MGLTITLSDAIYYSFVPDFYQTERCVSSNGQMYLHIRGNVQPMYNTCATNGTDLPFFDNPELLYKCFQECLKGFCNLSKVILTSFFCGDPLCADITQCQLSTRFTKIVKGQRTYYAILKETVNEDGSHYTQLYIIFALVCTILLVNITKKLFKCLNATIEYRKNINYAPISTVSDKLLEEDICSICIEPYEMSQKIRTLSCKHVFHKDCIDSWKNAGNKRCPLCNEEFW